MRVLAYTSPARGHLGPMMGPLLELSSRGADVHVRTLAAAVDSVRDAGLACEPIDPAIEAIEIDDYAQKSQLKAGERSFEVFAERAPHDAADFERALAEVSPDVAVVDVNAFGARAVAEREGLDWAESRPYLLEDSPDRVPPFGFGLRPKDGVRGRLRDAVFGAAGRKFDKAARLPTANAARRAVGLPELDSAAEAVGRAPLTLYFTATPFEYERRLPPGFSMVGAGEWDPAAGEAPDMPDDGRPLALVTCSSEFQDDGEIAAAALVGLPERWRVVVTTAGANPEALPRREDAVVRRFLPHRPLLERADVAICHGGMGVTQKALAHGVPVCVVPWGRDQLDVAAHVVEAGAGVRLSRRRLSPERLARTVELALSCRAGAQRVREGFEATGGSAAAADSLQLLAT